MSATLIGVLAGLFSAALFALLGLRDPKRLRSLPASGRTPASRGERRLLAILALGPGVLLALAGWWPAWLIWSGATLTLGWVAVLLLAPSPRMPG